jgi:hypothetical protein
MVTTRLVRGHTGLASMSRNRETPFRLRHLAGIILGYEAFWGKCVSVAILQGSHVVVPYLAVSRHWRTLNLALNEFRYLPASGR